MNSLGAAAHEARTLLALAPAMVVYLTAPAGDTLLLRKAAAWLRSRGVNVFTPRGDVVRSDLEALVDAAAAVFLRGSRHCATAKADYEIARALGKGIGVLYDYGPGDWRLLDFPLDDLDDAFRHRFPHLQAVPSLAVVPDPAPVAV